MKIEHLQYALEVYRLGSINKAAKKLYLSQSSLSSIIKAIEGELEYPIFERGQAGIIPSRYAAAFFEHATKIVREYEALVAVPAAFEERADLSIVSSRFSFAMHCFYDFIREQPRGEFRDTFQEFGINRVIESIVTRNKRLGLLVVQKTQLPRFRDIAEKQDLEIVVTEKEMSISILMSPGHPLAGRESVAFDELKHYRFLTDVDVDAADILLEDVSSVLRVSDRASTYDAVKLEGYISTMLTVDAPDARRHGCVCLPLEGYENKFVLIYIRRKSDALNSREVQFLAYLFGKM